MADSKPALESGVNWPVVLFGVLALLLVVFIVPEPLIRTVVAAVITIGTVYVAQSRQEPVIENPLFEQLHSQHSEGLDRRKYGSLRSHTDRLLEHVRRMNQIAVDGREGKIAPRHAQAELDRLAGVMREVVDDIRKTAGVPTPMRDAGSKPSQPQIVMPKPADEPPRG
jgi:hypothetical protein